MMKSRFVTLSSMVVLAALSRLMPHPWNFTPIAAIALFGGAKFENLRHAFVVPFAAMILSDLFLGFHLTMWFVYPAFAVIILLGASLKHKENISSVFLTTVGGSVIFFVISNFGSWVFDPFYTKDFSGLVSCYYRGLPFLRHTFMGDLFYVGILFGCFAYLEKRHPQLQYQPQ